MAYEVAPVTDRFRSRRNSSSTEFTQMTTDILKEFGERYGEKGRRLLFDGFYQCFEKYPDFSFRDFFQVCKAGSFQTKSPLELVDLSKVTEWQDIGGRDSRARRLPVTARNARGSRPGVAISGIVNQGTVLGSQKWNAQAAFDAQNSRYISGCMKNVRAVRSISGIYQDGSVDQEQWTCSRKCEQHPEGSMSRAIFPI